jgi:amino acid transporter
LSDALRRGLGPATATFLVVGNMIGAGVFTTSGFAIADLRSRGLLLLAWAIGGVAAACGALCYGALARAIPESGGEYTFLGRTVHPRAGAMAGWVSLTAGFTAPIAAAALGLQAYLVSTFPIAGDARWVGTAAIALAALLHGLRLAPGVVAQNAVVVVKLLLIGYFVHLGLRPMGGAMVPMDRTMLDASGFDPGAFAVTLVWISLAYSGWNAAVYVAGEVRDPRKNVPVALLFGTGLVTVAYLALNATFLRAAPLVDLAGKAEVGAIAAEALGGPSLRKLLTGIVALALFSSVSSMVMAGPRVYARMAQDGALPGVFGRGLEVPRVAVLLQAVLAIVVVWLTDLRELLSYAGFTLSLCAATTVVGLVRLRGRLGAAAVPVLGWPLVPGLYLAITLFAGGFMLWRRPQEAWFGLATLLLALVLPAGRGGVAPRDGKT